MKKTLTIFCGLVVAGLCLSTQALGQSDDGEIHVRISKDFDGEKKTLDKTYRNEREMRDDPEYQEFAGDNNFSFNFPDGNTFVQIDRFGEENGFHFGFSDDENHNFRFAFPDGHEEFQEELEEYMEEMREKIEDLDFSEYSEELSEKLMELAESKSQRHNRFEYSSSSKISVDEVGDEDFNGRGTKNNLKLQSLRVNPTSGYRFNLNFKTTEEGELEIKILNDNRKEVYTNYFERFGGFFNETIDFSQRDPGNYLLEITLDGKSISKKIIVED